MKKLLRKFRKSENGFTLIEMIVVIMIIAILAAVTIPNVMRYIEEARGQQYVGETRSVYLAAQTLLTKGYAANEPINNVINTSADSAGKFTNATGFSDTTKLGNGNTYAKEFADLIGQSAKGQFRLSGSYSEGITKVEYINGTEGAYVLVTLIPGQTAIIAKVDGAGSFPASTPEPDND